MLYIAFVFTSSNEESATWEVDDILITGEEVVGIVENNAFASQINIYPNPAVNTVRISSSAKDQIELSLYSVTGTLLRDNVEFTGYCSLDISDLPGGIYFLNFTDENGNNKIEKLIIEN